MIIGLTGENCAGKGTVAEHLKKKSFYYLSLSDILREELAKEGKEITRESLIAKGNELREKFDAGVLAEKTVRKLDKSRNYVIDSIRNPAEVEELKKLPGFTLWYVKASAETRFERMAQRDREGDPKTFEAFKEIEEAEKSSDPKRQQLQKTIEMADHVVENEYDFQLLFDHVNKLLCELSSTCRVPRPSWDEYFMSIAKQVAARSNCMKRKVAALIVKDKRIISTGYNGTPRGCVNCDEGGCPRCNNFASGGEKLDECLCAHGEENAIVQAAYHGISVKDGTMYCTFSPCLYCTRMIINAGLVEVVYNENYPVSENSASLFKQAGVKLRQFKVDK